jgi:enoyl-CoA hydratase
MYQSIKYQCDERGMAVVTVNRPKKLNALNSEVLDELSDAVQKISADDEVKGVIITGAGDKAFVAGADIKELQALDEGSGRATSHRGQQVFQAIEELRKPVIAAVNGYALGGGAELAMACHLRIASEKASFGLPEVGLGLIPGYGGTQRLPRLVGRSRALKMILTGKPIQADEALEIGLVNSITGDPLMEAEEWLEQILSNAPMAVANAIEAVYHTGGKKGFALESDLFGALCATEDAKEGLSAFLEKREAKFKGK